jgi:hypothetical protein
MIVLSLNTEAFALELDASLEEFGLASLAEFELATFSYNTAQAVDAVVTRFLCDGGCLVQGTDSNYGLCIYVLDSEYEHNILVTVGDNDSSAWVQLASLTFDADKLVNDQDQRMGPGLLIDILQAIIDIANNMLCSCEFKMPSRPPRGQLQFPLPPIKTC